MATEGRSSQVGAEREMSGDEWEEKGVWRRVGNKVTAERRQSEGRAKARRRQSGREEETILLKNGVEKSAYFKKMMYFCNL